MVVTPERELLGANQLAHREPLIGVQRAERLVHQVDRRAAHDRARERHLLLIAARELLRVERQQALEVHPRGDRVDAARGRRRAPRPAARSGNPMLSRTVRCG